MQRLHIVCILAVPVWDVPRRCEALEGESSLAIALEAPNEPGAWRLLAFAADPGGRTGYASLPFLRPGGEGWAGVWWQHPVNNWGEEPGLAVAAGATEVRWRAWADTDEVVVNFFAGLRGPDGFTRETGDVSLTTEPTDYSLSLEGVDYSEVSGAFGWATSVEEPTVIVITDIVWVR